MTPKLQILSAEKRLMLAEQVNDLLPADKKKLIELINLEISDSLQGVYSDVSSAVYHHPLCPGFSFSSIKEASRSVVHFLLSQKWESPEMKLGSAFHTLILEPHLFDEQYPSKSLSADQLKSLKSMYLALVSHKNFDTLFNSNSKKLIENTFFAKCPVTSLWRKVRPDTAILDRALIDIKTTGAKTDSEYVSNASTYKYEGQMAYYLDTAALLGFKFPETYHVVVKRIEPFDVSIFTYDQTYLDAGAQYYMLGLEKIANLINTNSNYSSNEILRIAKRGARV